MGVEVIPISAGDGKYLTINFKIQRNQIFPQYFEVKVNVMFRLQEHFLWL